MDIQITLQQLAAQYRLNLQNKILARKEEMKQDDHSHYLLYNVLGIKNEQGFNIDLYQNIGRFLYKYAGAFLEQATFLCIQNRYPDAQKIRIPNTISNTPKTFEIDCLVQNLAHEIKWRDATTDGDHVRKETIRVQAVKQAGYIPIRIMFYYPQRLEAQKIQASLEKLYNDLGGRYYAGNAAWNYIKSFTGVNLLDILTDIIRKECDKI